MRRHHLLLAGMLGAVGSMACGEKTPAGPQAGQLTVSYTGSGTSDGAMLILVTGGVTGVTASTGYQVASASVGSNATRVVVTGALVPGAIFKIAVTDVAASHSAQVEAVADRNTFALGDPSGYQLTVRQ